MYACTIGLPMVSIGEIREDVLFTTTPMPSTFLPSLGPAVLKLKVAHAHS